MANTFLYPSEWKAKLQERLSQPVKWKDIADVTYSNARVVNYNYVADPLVQTLTRGTAYTYQDWTESNESLTVSTGKTVPLLKDRADLVQSTFANLMDMADYQGLLLNEEIETALFADHANITNFGAGDISGGTVADTTTITVSVANIDDIVTHLLRVISVANGNSLLARNGGFIVWRPADYQVLTTFLMSNGVNVADNTIKNGLPGEGGVNYMGFTHYQSNKLAANHVIAGIKKIYGLGILKGTYGDVVQIDDPGLISAVGIVARVDYGIKAWTKSKTCLFDVNVA